MVNFKEYNYKFSIYLPLGWVKTSSSCFKLGFLLTEMCATPRLFQGLGDQWDCFRGRGFTR